MTVEELEALFAKYDNEYIKFGRIINKRSSRPDLHAFLLLDSLCPEEREMDMVSAAEHDEIYLSVEPEKLARVVNEEQVVELIRCGVRLSEDGLCMFA